MAKEYKVSEGYLFEAQANVGWVQTFNMKAKAPAIANRIFDTKAHAEQYIHETTGSAIAGLVLSVISDTSALNGAYWVKTDASAVNNLSLEKIATGESVETDLSALKQEVSVIKGDVSSLKNADASLFSEVSALKLADSSLISEVSALKLADTSLISEVSALHATDTSLVSDISALRADIAALGGAFIFRGVVSTPSDLPSENQKNGDVWQVTHADISDPSLVTNTEYVWVDGEIEGTTAQWIELGSLVDLRDVYQKIADLSTIHAEDCSILNQAINDLDAKIIQVGDDVSALEVRVEALENNPTGVTSINGQDGDVSVVGDASTFSAVETSAGEVKVKNQLASINPLAAEPTMTNGLVSNTVLEDYLGTIVGWETITPEEPGE